MLLYYEYTFVDRICDGELKDSAFPGFSFIVDFLSKYEDYSIMVNFFVLTNQILVCKDPSLTVSNRSQVTCSSAQQWFSLCM